MVRKAGRIENYQAGSHESMSHELLVNELMNVQLNYPSSFLPFACGYSILHSSLNLLAVSILRYGCLRLAFIWIYMLGKLYSKLILMMQLYI